MRFPLFILSAGLGWLLPHASHATQVFTSGPAQVSLIELYTSEGCSSCPPAEKWLGELRDDAGLWRQFVPVAFHVEYWDRLGWRDVYASLDYTRREYAYAQAWGSSTVYTPCFVRNGAEWHARSGSPGTTDTADHGRLSLTHQADGTCRIEYTPPAGASGEYAVQVALLGGGIVSQVRAGENSGRNLRHEFVALRLDHAPLKSSASGALSAILSLAPRPDLKAARHAIAAWVIQRGRVEPIQAVGGWLE